MSFIQKTNIHIYLLKLISKCMHAIGQNWSFGIGQYFQNFGETISNIDLNASHYLYNTKSSAIAMIADRTGYNVQYSYRSLFGIPVVSMSAVFPYLQFQTEVCFCCLSPFCQLLCFVAKWYILWQKCLKK